MAAHRYWRIKIRVTGGGLNGGIGELQMRTSIGGSNVATGGTPSSSSLSASYLPAKAFDGNTTATGVGNAWAALTMGGSTGLNSYPWLAYDFGSGNDKDIAEIVIYSPGTGGLGASELPMQFDIQWSDDNVTWVTQRSIAYDTPWTLLESRVTDVRALGPIDIHNGIRMNNIAGQKSIPVGRPGELTYDPDTDEGKIHFDFGKYWHDPVHGGPYKIAGSTTSLGDPVPRRVRLYHQGDGRIYREQYTNEDGLFEFSNLAIGPWVVVGIDDTGAQNGVIFSHVNAVPM